MNERSSQHWGILGLAVALVISSVILGGAIGNIKRGNDTITVTGSARRPIRSNYIVWRGSVSSQQPTMQAAYQDVKRYTDRVKAYLKQHRVPENIVTLPSVETDQIEEYTDRGRTGRILAYRLTQRFEVRSDQVDSIAALSRQAAELISDGVPLMSFPPEYLFTKLADVRVEMLAEATKDAQNRAKTIAESAGCKIGPVRNARMGVFQITARNSTEVSDYGIYDTSSLDKDITAVVSLSFSVK
ncbi:SIMPL domain-containing protein [candidate division KSB1 bacterium]|nr:MAG: SIMPL domain-containing protein [candidate division KSB1 bacterium]